MASKYRKKFSLPEEFYQILEAYSREVLRDQPLDILEYSYLYFKALEEGTIDKFDYPKKGINIPPSKHGRPERPQHEVKNKARQQEQQEDYDQEGANEYGEEDQNANGQTYYDENGDPVQADGDQDNYGQEDYGQDDGAADY